MKFAPGNAQHIGARSEQQDSFGFSDPDDRAFVAHGGVVAVVADGMGGMENGSAASAAAVRAFLAAYESKEPAEPIADALLRSIQSANDAVARLAGKGSARGNVGTTLAAAALHEDWLYWVSAGDSRVYYFPARHDRLVQLTQDHVYAADLQEKVAKGHITRHEAETHPERASLTSYLGLDALPRVDRSVRAFPVKPGDAVLICSDGLYRALSDEEIAGCLEQDPRRTCDKLVHHALGKGIESQDNITVVLLHCRRPGAWLNRRVKLAAAAALVLLAAAALFWRLETPSIRFFAVDGAPVGPGKSAVLRWSVARGAVTITPGGGQVPNIGFQPVSPSKKTTYMLTARTRLGSISRAIDVDVAPAPERPPEAPRIAMFAADPPAVKPGGSVKVSWNITGNVSEVRLNGALVKAADSLLVSNVASAATYTLLVKGGRGATETRALQVPLSAREPMIAEFTASPNSIEPGKFAVLKWSVKAASSVRIAAGSAGTPFKTRKPAGSLKLSPAVTTVYTLTASGAGPDAVSRITVTVVPARIIPVRIDAFAGDKSAIDGGDNATLTWKVTGDPRSIAIDPGIGPVKPAGSVAVSPAEKTVYTLSAKDAGGTTVSRTFTVDVLPVPKIEEFKITGSRDAPVLQWRVSAGERATRISIEPGIGPVPAASAPEGLPVKTPPADRYTLTVEGPGARTESRSADVARQPG